MARVRNPETVSSTFHIDPEMLARVGALDATLAADTKLFIDPLLLRRSVHQEMRVDGAEQYRQHFQQVIAFLVATHRHDDVAWRAARRLLSFHEIRGTCLGYGAASIHGSGFGRQLTERILAVGKEIVDLGIRDPDLFPAMALFESKIGADRISDMTTTVIRRALISFNERVITELGLTGQHFSFADVDGCFLVNPHQPRRTPLILVPSDILRRLPIANDWDSVADAASHNESLRMRVNQHVGHLWAAKTKRDKDMLRQQALSSADAFQALLDAVHAVPQRAYDTGNDPDGLLRWTLIAKEITSRFPLPIPADDRLADRDSAHRLVLRIVERFRHLIENKGLNKELYQDSAKPRHESTAQRLFFAIAYSYCKAANLDISPEVDTGTGKIDFKFSNGFACRVLVEVKLSTNPGVVNGYANQLEIYKQSEETTRAVYLVIDVGGMGKKHEALIDLRNTRRMNSEPISDLEVVDAKIRPSASKRK